MLLQFLQFFYLIDNNELLLQHAMDQLIFQRKYENKIDFEVKPTKEKKNNKLNLKTKNG